RRPARSCAFGSEPDESFFARASVLFRYPDTAVEAQDGRTATYHLAIGKGASIEVAERIAGDRLAKRLRVFVHLPRDGRVLELGVLGPEICGSLRHHFSLARRPCVLHGRDVGIRQDCASSMPRGMKLALGDRSNREDVRCPTQTAGPALRAG